jgi:hypothetical protein
MGDALYFTKNCKSFYPLAHQDVKTWMKMLHPYIYFVCL